MAELHNINSLIPSGIPCWHAQDQIRCKDIDAVSNVWEASKKAEASLGRGGFTWQDSLLGLWSGVGTKVHMALIMTSWVDDDKKYIIYLYI